MRYRIGIINDYRGYTAVIDYQRFGDMVHVYDAFRVTCGDNKGKDGIHVFLNFRKLKICKSNAEADELIKSLIKDAPNEWFEENRNLLI